MTEHYEPSDKLASVRNKKERDRRKAWVEFFTSWSSRGNGADDSEKFADKALALYDKRFGACQTKE